MPSDSKGDSKIFSGALPDLVVGLAGIPVAFALQNIGESLAKKGSLASIEGLILVASLVAVYAVYSVVLIMTFEVGLKEPVLRLNWQKHHAFLLLLHTPPAVLFVGAVIGFGVAYTEKGPEFKVFSGLCALAVLGAYLPGACYPGILPYFWQSYRPMAILLLVALAPVLASFLIWGVLPQWGVSVSVSTGAEAVHHFLPLLLR